jgi:hypothetical protein
MAFAPGGSSSFTPERAERERERDPERTVREPHGQLAAQKHARNRADQQPAGGVQVDIARDQAIPVTPTSRPISSPASESHQSTRPHYTAPGLFTT